MSLINGIFNRCRHSGKYGVVMDGNDITDVQHFEDSSRALHGDSVIYDAGLNKITKVTKRPPRRLLGVLATSSKVTIGLTAKNVPKKRFVPMDKHFPNFAVSTKRALQSSDVYAIVKIDDWMAKEKYPSATLERIIGDVGDLEAEKECLRIKYGINWKKYKRVNMDDYLTDLTPERHDMTDILCFSVDPPGSKDIDDVLHFRRMDDDTFEVGIHIADVSSFIPFGSQLDDEFKTRGESVYLKDKQINMMPDILATNHCSLLEGEPRRAFSVIITLNGNLEKVDVRFMKTMIVNKRAMTYDDVNKLGDDDMSRSVKELYLVGERLYKSNYHKRVSLDVNRTYDSHIMVEIFMIMANVEVANMMIKVAPNSAIIRNHKGIKRNECMTQTEQVDLAKAVKVINTLKMERANYVPYGDNIDNGHVGLGEEFYTHFTSPIRRYFDVTVHRILWMCISDKDKVYTDLSRLCEHLNDCHKRIGDAHRDSDRLDKIYDLYWDDPVMSTHGYIVSINDTVFSIFVPKLDIDLETKVISDKVVHLVDYVTTEDEFVMTNRQTGDRLEFRLLQRLEIRVIVSKKEPYVRRKLLVEILDPNPILFINN